MRPVVRIAVCVLACAVSACGALGEVPPEYEETLALAPDGSAVVDVNASLVALVVLRGAPIDPAAPVDIAEVRAFYESPGVTVTDVEPFARDGRLFVRVEVEADDVMALSRSPGLAWSLYRLETGDDTLTFRQIVGRPPPDAAAAATTAGWAGGERVAFRLRAPGEVREHNAPDGVERGNFVVWEQPMPVRVRGGMVDLRVTMDDDPILEQALTLFGVTILVAALAFALAIWWLVRRGRRAIS
jgi:hypothetical protein